MSEKFNQKAIDTLWYTRCGVPTPLGLASQLGWFEEEFSNDGIQLKNLQDTSDAELRESHYDHHLPNSFRQGGNVPPIWAKARGSNTRVIGLNWVDESQLILALPDSGIKAPSDLRGRRIALPVHGNTIDHGRAGALRGFTVALAEAGVEETAVEWFDIQVPRVRGVENQADGRLQDGGYPGIIQALLDKRVDAVFVKGARGAQVAHETGATIVYDIRNHPDPLIRANNGAPRPVTVNQELLDERPDLVVRFLARIVAVGGWAAAHRAETFAYVARETHSNEKWVRHAYGEDLHLRQGIGLSETAIQGLEKYKDFLYERGFLQADFDVRAWIDPSPLQQIERLALKKVA